MSDIQNILSQFSDANVSITVDGPPTYDSGRVIVRGDVNGFRLLAGILNSMAEIVAAGNHPASIHGWHVGISPRDVPQLEMDNSMLILDCDPQHRVPPLRG